MTSVKPSGTSLLLYPLLPHAITVPSDCKTIEFSKPPSTFITSVRLSGTVLSPSLFLPQETTLPSEDIPKTCLYPADIFS